MTRLTTVEKVPVEIDGKTFHLLFTFAKLLEIKKTCGINLEAGEMPRAEHLLDVIMIGLVDKGDLTTEKLGDLIYAPQLGYYAERIVEALTGQIAPSEPVKNDSSVSATQSGGAQVANGRARTSKASGRRSSATGG